MSVFSQWMARLGQSRTARLLGIGLLVLLLRIPVSMIEGLVFERQQRGAAAVSEITSSWGGAQNFTGPVLVVPFSQFWAGGEPGGAPRAEAAERHAVFLPRELRMRGKLRSDVRHRGIFSVPVYTLELYVEGEFNAPDFEALGIPASDADFSRAAVAVGLSDVHAVSGQPALDWDGVPADFLPGAPGLEWSDGMHAPVELREGTAGRRFSFMLVLNGSLEFTSAPFAETTIIELESNYPHPSFHGKWLPLDREVTDEGFSATWNISFLGRGYPQSWVTSAVTQQMIEASKFGVRLEEPVDHYRMSERSVKYAALFIFMTFALLWMMETFSGIRIHPVQFLLFGAALCLFYLLELSLSEHLGFAAAYTLASASVIFMVCGYSAAVLRSRQRALVIGAACAALYGYLYFLLAKEDYSLLIGSVVLFMGLGVVMYATRRRDWYARE